MRAARLALFAIVAVAIAVAIRWNTFTAWGTDPSAYMRAAHRWARGELYDPARFVFAAPWAADGQIETPFGDVPGPIRGTIVSMYPLGYPVLLAAVLELCGSLAALLVGPFCAGLLAACAYLLAVQVSGPWAGVIAAALVGATPIALADVVMPMSDVPGAAMWALALVMATRPGCGAAAAAGAATALAVMIRPYLAPIAVVIAVFIFTVSLGGTRGKFARLASYAGLAAIGLLIVLWSQHELYGNAWSAGYGSPGKYFSAEHVTENALAYIQQVRAVHTWLPFAGIVTIWFVWRQPSHRSALPVALAALLLVNYALYLPYLVLTDWMSLRFVLPGLVALFVLFAAALVEVYRRLRVLVPAPLAVSAVAVVLAIVLGASRDELRQVGDNVSIAGRMFVFGRYLDAALPANAVVISYLHSGAIAFYTHRPILRLDTIPDPSHLDAIVREVATRGYRPFLAVDRALEAEWIRSRFASSASRAIDWPPRAMVQHPFPFLLLDPVDRDEFRNGQAWPIDAIAWPPGMHPADAPPVPSFDEPALLPSLDDTLYFRRTLESIYQHQLGRSLVTTRVPPEEAVMWLRRYVRYRVRGCPHATAVRYIFEQIGGGHVFDVCDPTASNFPPRDELLDFRQALERRIPPEGTRPFGRSYVDLEGDAIWTAEYLRYRMQNCSHGQAVDLVKYQVSGIRDQVSGIRFQGSGIRFQGSGIRDQGSG